MVRLRGSSAYYLEQSLVGVRIRSGLFYRGTERLWCRLIRGIGAFVVVRIADVIADDLIRFVDFVGCCLPMTGMRWVWQVHFRARAFALWSAVY